MKHFVCCQCPSVSVCARLCQSVFVCACTTGAMLALGTDQSLPEVRSLTDFREGLSDKLELGGLPSPSQERWRFLFRSGGVCKVISTQWNQFIIHYSHKNSYFYITLNFFGWVLCPNSIFYRQQTSAGFQKLDMSAGLLFYNIDQHCSQTSESPTHEGWVGKDVWEGGGGNCDRKPNCLLQWSPITFFENQM